MVGAPSLPWLGPPEGPFPPPRGRGLLTRWNLLLRALPAATAAGSLRGSGLGHGLAADRMGRGCWGARPDAPHLCGDAAERLQVWKLPWGALGLTQSTARVSVKSASRAPQTWLRSGRMAGPSEQAAHWPPGAKLGPWPCKHLPRRGQPRRKPEQAGPSPLRSDRASIQEDLEDRGTGEPGTTLPPFPGPRGPQGSDRVLSRLHADSARF